ncbi:MAG: two-component sensor histidine kinase [Candidatus Gottesmanbacteria bacterium GW2011_GWA2_43_14]|uniref:histidine kinase n=1 Tax=Candidatus Gottesmanbacteria bacterium GW2011_GWA2_43_14 TaxID=1618443 RepID=A0A0G1DFQ0_9BACT|nr:MAG: two-component sensor histidine kinase [Candidatus Gottesmanbacteria bacterium GW2011_GWA2_43_14]
MFSKARLKLTAWYLVIIMSVSLLFSAVIYRSVDIELSRIERRQQVRIERFRQELFRLPDFPDMFVEVPVTEIRRRLIAALTFINSGILIISGGAGFFLAGRTLKPIEDMVNEQNRFIADASHEFRTPLTSLKSQTEVSLRDKKLTLSQAKEMLASNLEEADNLQAISDRLLELAQIEKPNYFVFKAVDIKSAVNSALSKVRPLAKQKSITVASQIKSRIMEGDGKSLTEMLVIFLDNAIKYSRENTSVNLTGKISGQSQVLVISDQGSGISKEDLPHIFERFYRGDKSRSASGYGLGLSIAKKIIDAHHGTVEVASKKNQGTTFTVRLPLKQSVSFI